MGGEIKISERQSDQSGSSSKLCFDTLGPKAAAAPAAIRTVQTFRVTPHKANGDGMV